jgi:hypothetical protein
MKLALGGIHPSLLAVRASRAICRISAAPYLSLAAASALAIWLVDGLYDWIEMKTVQVEGASRQRGDKLLGTELTAIAMRRLAGPLSWVGSLLPITGRP